MSDHTTRVILVRHGQSAAKSLGIVQGSGVLVPLTEEGVAQARALAEVLRSERFDAIYTSHARRAIDTAASIRAFHPDVPYAEVPALVERSKGEAEGLTRDLFRERYPAIQAAWDQEEDAVPPGGESFAHLHARVMPVLEQHLVQHGAQTSLLYVLHGNVNRVILGQALGIPFGLQPRIVQDCCAMSEMTYDHEKKRWEVQYVNRRLAS